MKTSFDFEKFDLLLGRGLCAGLQEDGRFCIGAAVALCNGEKLNAAPECVLKSGNAFAIILNDARWSSPQARAKGLRRFALAQVDTRGLDEVEFCTRLLEQTIRQIVPIAGLDEAALRCAAGLGDISAAVAAATAAVAAATAARSAAYAAFAVARHATEVWSAAAATAAFVADAKARYRRDEVLTLSANIAAEILEDMKVPRQKV